MRAAAAAALAAAALPAPARGGERAAPRVTVSLDDDPYHRWDAVIDRFLPAIKIGFGALEANPLSRAALAALGAAMGDEEELKKWYPADQWREMEGLSARCGEPVGRLTAMASLYDVTASGTIDALANLLNASSVTKQCTGIVAQTAAGDIVHGRNLDYALLSLFVNQTAVVDFQRGGRTLYTSVMFLPAPGFNTVMRPGAFTLSHDERDQGSVAANIDDVFIRQRVMTFSTIRTVAETAETYDAAIAALSSAPLSAASYFVVGGTEAGDGAVITRDRDAAVDTWRLDAGAGRWYVLETNYDHWKAPGKMDNRRAPAQRMLNATGPGGMSAERMWAVMTNTDARRAEGERATFNAMTIYTVVMQAKYPERLKAVIHDPPYPGTSY